MVELGWKNQGRSNTTVMARARLLVSCRVCVLVVALFVLLPLVMVVPTRVAEASLCLFMVELSVLS